MNRLVAIILSAIIFMSLAACGTGNDVTEASSVKREYATELTDEKRQELVNVLLSRGATYEQMELGSGNVMLVYGGLFEYYYGTYDGYDVFIAKGSIIAYQTLAIEDLQFGRVDRGIYVHRNGDLMELQDAYDNGWITYEDLAAIHHRHLQCQEENYP